MKIAVTVIVALFFVLVVGHFETPGGLLCLVSNPGSPTAPTTHDTDWAYCRTLMQLARYQDSGVAGPLFTWLVDSNLDGGAAETVRLTVNVWIAENPAWLVNFEAALTPKELDRFRSRYVGAI